MNPDHPIDRDALLGTDATTSVDTFIAGLSSDNVRVAIALLHEATRVAPPLSVQKIGTGQLDRQERRALMDLVSVRAALADSYTPLGVEAWLHSGNRNMNGRRPYDLIMAGDLDPVKDELTRLWADGMDGGMGT